MSYEEVYGDLSRGIQFKFSIRLINEAAASHIGKREK
jgi:hypothetical protein